MSPSAASSTGDPLSPTDYAKLLQVLNRIEADLSTPPDPKKARAPQVTLKEVEGIYNSLNDDIKSLTSRAGTILSILIAVVTAILSVAILQYRPAYWVPLIPAVPLLIAIFTSSWLFVGWKVPTLNVKAVVASAGKDEDEAAKDFIALYQTMILGGTGPFNLVRRVISQGTNPNDSPAEHPEKIRVDGVLEVLNQKQKLFDWSVVLLGITLALVIVVSLVLY